MLKRKEVKEVIEILKKDFPDAETELDFTNNIELLIATILSAQCTDVRVNKVTKELFKEFKKPEDYLKVSQKELGDRIHSCGFYNQKSKSIQGSMKMILEDFNGEVPNNMEDLLKLPGVGRKTANVVLSNAYNIPAIAVDTHVFRVSNRIGIANGKDVEEVEKQLMKQIDKEDWIDAHNLLIFQGRRTCMARSPKCEECPLTTYCKYYKDLPKNKM